MSQKTCASGMVVGCQKKNKFSCYNFRKGLQLSILSLRFPEGKGVDRFNRRTKFDQSGTKLSSIKRQCI